MLQRIPLVCHKDEDTLVEQARSDRPKLAHIEEICRWVYCDADASHHTEGGQRIIHFCQYLVILVC